MKKFLAFLFCAATLAGFASCSDDEKESVECEDEGDRWVEKECYAREQ